MDSGPRIPQAAEYETIGTNNRRSAIIWEIGEKSELVLDSMMARS
jgi:hypothetical protein